MSLRTNNLADLPQPEANQKYIFNTDGWDYVKCFVGYGDVTGSMRKKWMYASLINLIWLNELIEENEILEIAHAANKSKIRPMFKDEEINKMVKTLYLRSLEEDFEPSYSKKKIIFNESLNLTGKERQKLALEANIQMKRNKKELALYRILEDWNFEKCGKITQRAIIALKAGVGKKAVERYYREFKDYIDSRNEEYLLPAN